MNRTLKNSIWLVVLPVIALGIMGNCRQEYEPENTAKPKPAPTYDIIEMNVSAYCPNSCCCGVYSDGITASGHEIQPGDKLVAAPREYAFGTIMDVPGYGMATVQDRGGAIKGNKIDLLFSSHQEA